MSKRLFKPIQVITLLVVVTVFLLCVWRVFLAQNSKTIFFARIPKEFNHLEGEIFDEITSDMRRSKIPKMPLNRSVLTDPYYTVQFDPKAFTNLNKPCVDIDDLFKYSLCTLLEEHGKDVAASKFGVPHFRMFGNLLRFLQKSPSAGYIDLGANVGSIAIPIMSTIGTDRAIVALEALPGNVELLITSVVRNKFPKGNWAIIQRALADTADESVEFIMHYNVPTNGALKSKIKDSENAFTGEKIIVKTATLDSHVLPVAKAMNMTTAIMKIDIEGAECVAFRKADSLLREIDVQYIVMEFSYHYGYADDDCIKHMFGVLTNASYYPFSLSSLGLSHAPLDTKRYKRWLDLDVVWKKIL